MRMGYAEFYSHSHMLLGRFYLCFERLRVGVTGFAA
jgi:hypothetical protein